MTQRSEEHKQTEGAAFRAFVADAPALASAAEAWEQPDAEFPDIIVRMKDGRRIAFELGEWLHEAQMGAAKRRESLGEALTSSLEPLGKNPTRHIRFVLLEPLDPGSRFNPADRELFKPELLKLVSYLDERWESEGSWRARASYSCRNFKSAPVLGRYLRTALVDGGEVNGESKEPYPEGAPWIDVAPTGGAYNPQVALEALSKIIELKSAKYGRLSEGVSLLIHYGRGWLYNTPFRGIEIRTFEDVARQASEQLRRSAPYFERVYLVNTLDEPGPTAFQIFPELVPGRDIRA